VRHVVHECLPVGAAPRVGRSRRSGGGGRESFPGRPGAGRV